RSSEVEGQNQSLTRRELGSRCNGGTAARAGERVDDCAKGIRPREQYANCSIVEWLKAAAAWALISPIASEKAPGLCTDAFALANRQHVGWMELGMQAMRTIERD